jgi:hypothetical protein
VKKGSGKWAGAVCCICGKPFSGSFDNKPYCNMHWLRIYNYGTTEKIGRKSTNIFVISGDVMTVHTKSGDVIIADAEDYDKLSKYSWCISKTGYAVANINGKVTKMHRYILDDADGYIIDHSNGNRLDNRKLNLRKCTNTENARNVSVSKNSRSGVLGVRITPNNRYVATIMVNRKTIYIGTYDTLAEAKTARMKAEIKYFGEYAPCLRGVLT